ncbi:hypothetical protein WJ63_26415 [Burkholderia pyrrocinia]|nr:hypothetical protein WJ63_26415 [Burkholderia pyrrocinia]
MFPLLRLLTCTTAPHVSDVGRQPFPVLPFTTSETRFFNGAQRDLGRNLMCIVCAAEIARFIGENETSQRHA